MKNVFKSKFLVSFLSLVMVITLLMFPTVVFANDTIEVQNSIQPRWSYLYVCSNGLQAASDISGAILIYGCTEVYSGHAGVEIQLQKWSGTRWLNYSDFYWEDYSSTGMAEAFEDNIEVPAGVYRLSLVHTAYSSSGVPLESFSAYSNELTVRPSN